MAYLVRDAYSSSHFIGPPHHTVGVDAYPQDAANERDVEELTSLLLRWIMIKYMYINIVIENMTRFHRVNRHSSKNIYFMPFGSFLTHFALRK